jgi:hypothetical protein
LLRLPERHWPMAALGGKCDRGHVAHPDVTDLPEGYS